MSSWRDRLSPIVADALAFAQDNGMTVAETRQHLRNAFPCGERKYHPYKIWLDEIRLQTGKKHLGTKTVKPLQGQQKLF